MVNATFTPPLTASTRLAFLFPRDPHAFIPEVKDFSTIGMPGTHFSHRVPPNRLCCSLTCKERKGAGETRIEINHEEWAGWTRIGGWGYDETLNMDNVPDWVCRAIRELSRRDALRTALYNGTCIELKGKHYRYRLVPLGQGVSDLWVYRKPR